MSVADGKSVARTCIHLENCLAEEADIREHIVAMQKGRPPIPAAGPSLFLIGLTLRECQLMPAEGLEPPTCPLHLECSTR